MDNDVQFSSEYKLLWLGTASERVGEVRNYAMDGERYRVVPIRHDQASLDQIHMRMAALTYGKDCNPRIVVGDQLVALPLALREACVWHEMGHVHFEHMFGFEHASQADLRAARIAATEKGGILPEEAEADRFAVAHAGKDAVLAYLNYALETRPSGGRLGWNDSGRRELEMRLAKVRSIGRNGPCPCGSGRKYKHCCLK